MSDVPRVVVDEYTRIHHAVRDIPDPPGSSGAERHGTTMCRALWDHGPCTNIHGRYVPKMVASDGDVDCLLCLAAEEIPQHWARKLH